MRSTGRALAQPDHTVVFYMSAAQSAHIAERLLGAWPAGFASGGAGGARHLAG